MCGVRARKKGGTPETKTPCARESFLTTPDLSPLPGSRGAPRLRFPAHSARLGWRGRAARTRTRTRDHRGALGWSQSEPRCPPGAWASVLPAYLLPNPGETESGSAPQRKGIFTVGLASVPEEGPWGHPAALPSPPQVQLIINLYSPPHATLQLRSLQTLIRDTSVKRTSLAPAGRRLAWQARGHSRAPDLCPLWRLGRSVGAEACGLKNT